MYLGLHLGLLRCRELNTFNQQQTTSTSSELSVAKPREVYFWGEGFEHPPTIILKRLLLGFVQKRWKHLGLILQPIYRIKQSSQVSNSNVELSTRWSSAANCRSLCFRRRTFLWPWPLNPSPWRPNQFVSRLYTVSIWTSFCSNLFSGSGAIKLPSLPDLDLWPMTLKTFSHISIHIVIICTSFIEIFAVYRHEYNRVLTDNELEWTR